MMRKFKKALSLLLVAVIAVTSLVCGAVSAGAYDDFDEDTNLYAYYKQQGDDISIYISGIEGSKMSKIINKDYENVHLVFKADGSTLDLSCRKKPDYQEAWYKGNSIGNMIKSSEFEKVGSDYTFVMVIQNKFNVISTLKKATTVDVTISSGKTPNETFYNNIKTITVQFYNSTDEIKNISYLDATEIGDQIYTGEAITPKVKVKKGMTLLKKGKDYTVKYKNNKKMGIGSVTIKGKGKYIGSVTHTFKILPKTPDMDINKSGDSYKVTWDKVTGAKKYEIFVSDDGGKTFEKTTVSGSKTSRTLTLDSDESYVIKMRCYGKNGKTKYYSNFTDTITV